MYSLNETSKLNLKQVLNNSGLVIFGSNGALGRSFAVALQWYNINPKYIILVSRQTNPAPEWIPLSDRVTHLVNNDTRQSISKVSKLVQENGFQYTLIYGSGYGQPKKFMADSHALIQSSVVDYHYAISHLPQPKFVAYMSTAEVYNGNNLLAVESTNPIINSNHPRAIYLASKLLGEALTFTRFADTDTRACCYRVALAFSPSLIDGDSRVLSDLLRGAITSKRVTLNGGSQLMRQYQYGPNAAIQILSSLVNGRSLLYNCAGSHKLSLGDLASMIAELTSSSLEINSNLEDSSSQNSVNVSYCLVNDEAGIISHSECELSDYLRLVLNIGALSRCISGTLSDQ